MGNKNFKNFHVLNDQRSYAARVIGADQPSVLAVLKVDERNLPVLPAERAGLKPGDIITTFNGAPVSDTNSLSNAVAGSQPGAEVTLTIIRERQPQELRATLGELNTNVR